MRSLRPPGTMADMADDLPKPEPKEIDEKLALQLKHLAEDAVLKGKPYGDERCDNCLFYLNPDENISYCWHPKLRILVGGELVVPVVGEDRRTERDVHRGQGARRAATSSARSASSEDVALEHEEEELPDARRRGSCATSSSSSARAAARARSS